MTSVLTVYDSDLEKGNFIESLKLLGAHRALIQLLVFRDLTARYKRSVLGLWWTLLNPMLIALVLFFVFNNVFRFRMIDGASFASYLLSGVLVVTLFSQGVSAAADSVASAGALLTKIYVPGQVFVFSASVSAGVNFLVGLLPLALISVLNGEGISPTAPLSIIVAGCFVLLISGFSLILALLYVRYEDVRSIFALLLLLLTYLTPVFYPKTILEDLTLLAVNLNPLTSYLDCFRWAFNSGSVATMFDWAYMLISAVFTFSIGLAVFARYWPRTVALF